MSKPYTIGVGYDRPLWLADQALLMRAKIGYDGPHPVFLDGLKAAYDLGREDGAIDERSQHRTLLQAIAARENKPYGYLVTLVYQRGHDKDRYHTIATTGKPWDVLEQFYASEHKQLRAYIVAALPLSEADYSYALESLKNVKEQSNPKRPGMGDDHHAG